MFVVFFLNLCKIKITKKNRIMNLQYSRVGKTYPRIGSYVLSTKATRNQNSFSNTEENKTVLSPTNSKVSRLLKK
jgi:hypothetical protein